MKKSAKKSSSASETVKVVTRRFEYIGKKQLAQEAGLVAHHGTDWHYIMEPRKDYVPQPLPDEGWDFSLTDWEDRIINLRPLVVTSRFPLNKNLADRAIKAFRKLKLADVIDTPALDEAGERWFRDIVRLVFGCYDPVRKIRMIKELFLLVPKKNSKTTYGALLMLLIMIFNERPKGKAIMVAPERIVAGIAFDAISGAIELDDVLKARFIVKDIHKKIIDRKNRAELSVMTFDPSALTGQKVFAALIDELHVMSKVAKAPSAIRQIRGGMIPFPEAILIFITTQSEEAPAGVFKAELNAARNVRDGKRQNAKLFPILYEFPESIQRSKEQLWKDPKYWPMVTPNLGRSIQLDILRDGFLDAESKGDVELKSWASQHLNIEIGVAIRAEAWAGARMWEQAYYEKARTLDSILACCEVVTAGIDGGGLDDLLSLSIVGREVGTGNWLAWTRSWLAKEGAEARKSEVQLLDDLQKTGDLVIVDKMGIDVDQLVEILVKCEKAGLLHQIGLDPYGVGSIVDAIYEEGFAEDRLVGISQGWRLGGAIKSTERTLAEGKFKHGNQPIMQWAVGNAKVEPRGNATLITKQASGTGKIDPLMATFNAVHLMSSNPASKAKRYQVLVFGNRQRSA